MPRHDVYKTKEIRRAHDPRSIDATTFTDPSHDAAAVGYFDALAPPSASYTVASKIAEIDGGLGSLDPHVLATITGLGPFHSVSGLTSGQVLRATAATAARFMQLAVADLSGLPVTIAQGGTGQTGQTAAFDALAPTTTGGDLIYYNGTDNVRLGIGANGTFLKSNGSAPAWSTILSGDLPSHVHSAADITSGQLALARGGTAADMSATGGTGHVVKQASAGAAFTTGQVQTADVANANITLAKIANAAANDKLLGSGNAGSGASYTEITLGSGLTMTGTTLSASGGAPTNATYIVQTADATLTNEQALGALATGILKNTTTTGVLSIATGSDLPSHTHSAADITSGILALARGGTGADLSSTGGTSFVLRQSSAGAVVTVSQLAASDLSNGVTGSGAVVLASSPTITTPTIASFANAIHTHLNNAGGGTLTPAAMVMAAADRILGSTTGTGGTDIPCTLSGRSAIALNAVLGDIIVSGGADDWGKLAGNTTTTRKFLRQVGNGTISTLPAWDTIASGDLPSHSHAAGDITSGTLALARGGTGADMSSTGGTGHVVKQDSAGAALTTGLIVTANVTDANITLAKIANAAASSKLLGSGASGSGAPYAEITLGTNLSMSGTTLNATGGGGNSFETISCPAGTNPVADSATDTLTLVPEGAITITGNATNDEVTFRVDQAEILANPTVDGFLSWRDAGSGFTMTLSGPASIAGSNKVLRLPDVNGNVGALEATQQWNGVNTFNAATNFQNGTTTFGTGSAPTFAVTSTFNASVSFNAQVNIAGGSNIATSSSTGTKFGTNLGSKIAFYTNTPISQQTLISSGINKKELAAGLRALGVFANANNAWNADLQGGNLLGVASINSRGFQNNDESTTYYDGATIPFKIQNTTEMTLAANELAFETGSNDPALEWGTDGQLGIKIASNRVAWFSDNGSGRGLLTFEGATTDVAIGSAGSGQLDLYVSTNSLLRLTDNGSTRARLDLEGGTTDASLRMISSAMDVYYGSTRAMSFADPIVSRVRLDCAAVVTLQPLGPFQFEGALLYDDTQRAIGTVAYNGTTTRNMHFTRAQYSQTQDATKTNSTTNTQSLWLSDTGHPGLLNATNRPRTLEIGRTIRVVASGYYSHAVGTITFMVRYGSTVLCTSAAISPGSITSHGWRLEAEIAIRTLGATGTAYSQGIVTYFNASGVATTNEMLSTSAVTINTTTDVNIDVSIAYSTTGGGTNSITCTNGIMEMLM